MAKKKFDLGAPIGDKTPAQWDLEWIDVPGGFMVPHPEYRGVAGLYRANLNGQTMVIGMASERQGGRLSKRLSDFIRPSKSGRNHRVGAYIHNNADVLELQVLLIGRNYSDLRLCHPLRKAMIELHKPRINVPAEIVKKVAFG